MKILDFGLVRPTRDDVKITGRGDIIGTPAYMAPEQARGGAVDEKADLYSLGCVLYRALTGSPTFPYDNPVDVMIALATQSPKPVASVNPKAPAAVSDSIMRLAGQGPGEAAGVREGSP